MDYNIKVFSPMRSCSNYTLKLVDKHFPVNIIESPWKHGDPTRDTADYGDIVPDLYFICLKNPYALWNSFKQGFTKGRLNYKHFINNNDPWFVPVMDKLEEASKQKNGNLLKDKKVLKCWIEKQNYLNEAYLTFYNEDPDTVAIITHDDLLTNTKAVLQQIATKFTWQFDPEKFKPIERSVATDLKQTLVPFDPDFYIKKQYLNELQNFEFDMITDDIDWDLPRQFGFQPEKRDISVRVKDGINLVYYGDFGCHTGFGRVADGILTNLPKSWNIRCLGINYTPGLKDDMYAENIRGYSVKYAENNPYGPRETLSYLSNTSFDYDLVLALQDTFIFDQEIVPSEQGRVTFIDYMAQVVHENNASLLTYFPIDTARPHPQWINSVIQASDHSVAYFNWARDIIQKYISDEKLMNRVSVIEHGCDNEKFYPLPRSVRLSGRRRLGIEDDEFLFFWLSANQRRKNIPRDVMGAFAMLAQKHNNARLIMKTHIDMSQHPGQGWNLKTILSQMQENLDIPDDCIGFLDQHYTNQELNLLYNIADCVYLPSMEGHGLAVTEAYSACRPVITANHGALSELGGAGRSLQVNVPKDLKHTIWFTRDNDVPRSLIDLDDFVDKAETMMDMCEEERQEIAQAGYEWAQKRSWKAQAKKWETLIERMVKGEPTTD